MSKPVPEEVSRLVVVNYVALALAYLGVCIAIAAVRLDDWDVVLPLYRTAYFYGESDFAKHISFDWVYTGTNPFAVMFSVSLGCALYSITCALGLVTGRLDAQFRGVISHGQAIMAMPFVMWIAAWFGGISQIELLIAIFATAFSGHAHLAMYPVYAPVWIILMTLGVSYPMSLIYYNFQMDNARLDGVSRYLVIMQFLMVFYGIHHWVIALQDLMNVQASTKVTIHFGTWLVAIAVGFTTLGLFSLPESTLSS